MTTELCDCVSYCGDDPRVHSYEVIPCSTRVDSAELKLEHLKDQILLIKVKKLIESDQLPKEVIQYLTDNSKSSLSPIVIPDNIIN